MQRVNLKQYYEFGYTVHALTVAPPEGSSGIDYLIRLMMADQSLDAFVRDEMIPMPISKGPAQELLNAIDALRASRDKDGVRRREDWEVAPSATEAWAVMSAASTFETVMFAELANMATYFVSQKAAYNTDTLIASADEVFTEDIRKGLAENEQTIRDIREAGKCVAFGLGTAAGFHMARAMESVILQYLEVLCPQELQKLEDKDRNLGGYIILAGKKGGNKKICAVVNQFRELYRNPLIHPNESLDLNEAIRLLGITQSAISEIILDIKKRKQKDGSPTSPTS